MNRKEQAVMLHKKNFNCAQATACTFCNVMGHDPVEVFKLAKAFGYGMGTTGTCGAVSGMALVTGMKISDGDLDNPSTKKECYAMMEKLTAEFLERNGSLECRVLKGIDTGEPLKSCDEYIKDAVEILDKYLLGIEE